MSTSDALLLVLAGVGAGLTGSVAGMASLVSYPVLLVTGLSPFTANVTNTVSLLANSVGSVVGSRRELKGQSPRLRVLATQCGLGGALGAALLLATDKSTFEAVVPWLVAFGAALLLLRDRLRAWVQARRLRLFAGNSHATTQSAVTSWHGHLLIFTVGIYGGYFGAGVGIILLAVLAIPTMEPLAVTNAVKNVGTSTANGVAAVAYMFLAPVDWPSAFALAAGGLVGGWLGPQIVRVLPERPLRYAIAVAGIGLAGWLLLV
jgi:uncharacterized protein